jgi:hypothetical protein
MRNISQIAHFSDPTAGQRRSFRQIGGKKFSRKTHSPTTVANITKAEKAAPSLRFVENHRENCAMTRPVSSPWRNSPAMPGPSTVAWLCKGPCDGKVELNMIVRSPQDAIQHSTGGEDGSKGPGCLFLAEVVYWAFELQEKAEAQHLI